MLKLQHLTKRFGTAPLFTDLCMEVDAPVVLWAPSGWGKTTLLRILMGLERPTAGSVEGVGRVAAVFQEDRLCPQLNAVQNVTLVLPGTEDQYKEQIISDFQQLGMELAALQLPARRLSGGQKRRVALLRAMQKRLGLDNVRPAVRDATALKEDMRGTMDVVLLDAPCSGLGVMADKPDVKYRVTPESVAELTTLQSQLLDAVAPYVKKGGTLVYSTCSVLKDENERQIAAFLARHPEFEAEDLPESIPEIFRRHAGQGLQLLPHRDHVGGFYICRMRRRKA